MILVARPDFRHLSQGLWYVFDLHTHLIIRDGFASEAAAKEWISHDDPVLRETVRGIIRRNMQSRLRNMQSRQRTRGE